MSRSPRWIQASPESRGSQRHAGGAALQDSTLSSRDGEQFTQVGFGILGDGENALLRWDTSITEDRCLSSRSSRFGCFRTSSGNVAGCGEIDRAQSILQRNFCPTASSQTFCREGARNIQTRSVGWNIVEVSSDARSAAGVYGPAGSSARRDARNTVRGFALTRRMPNAAYAPESEISPTGVPRACQ